jgi:hypothetical protein
VKVNPTLSKELSRQGESGRVEPAGFERGSQSSSSDEPLPGQQPSGAHPFPAAGFEQLHRIGTDIARADRCPYKRCALMGAKAAVGAARIHPVCSAEGGVLEAARRAGRDGLSG